MKKISIVIPVYCNAPSLFELFDELVNLENRLLPLGVEVEIIFVDDGSYDESFAVLMSIKQRKSTIKVIKLARNFGSVHAIKAGVKFITGDCFTFLSADLQDPPSLIFDMVQKWLNGANLVVCERISREDPLVSRIFSAIYYKVIRSIVLKDFPKGGFDLALMDKKVLPYISNSAKNLYLVPLIHWLGFKPIVIKYHRLARKHGKSKWTFAKKFKVFLDVVLGFSVFPIQAISAIGMAVSFISFFYGAFVVSVALVKKNPVDGFPTLVALITFLLGLIIFMLGVIGEYIWRIYDETNSRPDSVVEDVF